jgi:uncharacterized protein (TIGR02147 family)
MEESNTPIVKNPVILEYLDYRAYLKDKIAFLQSQNKKYSQRWIAQKAGFKAPQLISMILSGQRSLSETNAQLLAYALQLTCEEEEYLLMIVELAHADTFETQENLVNKIKVHFKNGIFQQIPLKSFEYLKHWYFPAVRELVAVKKYKGDASLIADALGIAKSEVEEALQTLHRLGLLTSVDGHLQRSEPSVKAVDFADPIVMAQYHLQVIQKSFNAMSLPRESRHFDTLTMAVPAAMIPEIKKSIQRFIRELDMLVESYPVKDDLWQMNVQLFSLTPGIKT